MFNVKSNSNDCHEKRSERDPAPLYSNITTVCGTSRTNGGAEVADDVAEHIWNFFPEIAMWNEICATGTICRIVVICAESEIRGECKDKYKEEPANATSTTFSLVAVGSLAVIFAIIITIVLMFFDRASGRYAPFNYCFRPIVRLEYRIRVGFFGTTQEGNGEQLGCRLGVDRMWIFRAF